MGDRYIVQVTCPNCGRIEEEVWYAPTCGVVDYECPCGFTVDLEELTGISYEEASNRSVIEELVKAVGRK